MIDKGALNVQSHMPIAGSVSGFMANGNGQPDEYLMSASIYSGGGGLGILGSQANPGPNPSAQAQINLNSKRKQGVPVPASMANHNISAVYGNQMYQQ